MERSLFLSAAAISLLSTLHVATAGGIAYPPSPAHAMPPSAINHDDFVHKSCAHAPHAHVCYVSLRPFANLVGHDIKKLSTISVSVSLSEARQLKPVQNHSDDDERAKAAVSNCQSSFDYAIGEIKYSLEQMQQLCHSRDLIGEAAIYTVTDVQTWMAAALTNLDKCKDGLGGLPDARLRSSLFNAAKKASQYTSNAVALVKLFGDSI